MTNKIQCPHCQGYKTNASRDAWKSLLLLGFATSWIFGLGLVFILIAPLVGLINRGRPNKVNCATCGYKFVA